MKRIRWIILISIIVSLIIAAQFFLKPKSEAVVTITFDDGYKEHYTVAFPILEKHGVKATEYIIAGLIDSEFEGTPTMSVEEVNALQKAGWEIGGHSLSHPYLTRLSVEELDKELEGSKLISGMRARSISIPYGDFNEMVKDYAKQHYESVRTSERGYNYFQNFDRYNLRSMAVTGKNTLEEMKSWVDYANDNDAWLIVMLHLVRPSKGSEYSNYGISPEDLDELIKYVKKKGIRIKTVSEVIDEKA